MMMKLKIENPAWHDFFVKESSKPYFVQLAAFVDSAYATTTVYPPRDRIFAAFEGLSPAEVKVVILGQDPYHEPGQAQGLAFYVPPSVKSPPSLVNIAKELQAEYGNRGQSPMRGQSPKIPDLLGWVKQGVLLLNATLTVAEGAPLSHRGQGWEQFTDAVIRYLVENREHLVFLLWGAYAQKKGAFINRSRHGVIECAHPSPLSARRGFFDSGCFKAVDEYLKSWGQSSIIW